MPIEFTKLIKAGQATFELDVLDPTIHGVVADVSTIGTATNNKQWVKIGEGDTDWRCFLTSETSGTFLGDFQIPDVSDTVPNLNVLGINSDGSLTIGDGSTVGGLVIGSGGGGGSNNTYNKSQIDNSLATKADQDVTYNKVEVDEKFSNLVDSVIIPHSSNQNNPHNVTACQLGLTIGHTVQRHSEILENTTASFTSQLEGEIKSSADVISDVNVGGIEKSDIIPSGTTLQSFIESILTKTYYPTFTIPSVSILDDIPSKVEIGTTGITLFANFNRGTINGDNLNGVWLNSISQGFRSGQVIQYTFSGTYIDTVSQPTNGLELSTEVIEEGSNIFNVSIDYAEGQQPKDSTGKNYQTPLAAGTISKSMNVNGKRNAFYGTSSAESAPSTSTEIRSLNSKIDPVDGTTFTISAPAGTKHVIFAYPESVRGVSEVKHLESNFDVSTAFDQEVISVSSFNNYDSVNYRVYVFTPIGPLDGENNYVITI
jgi:hypothetical protein